MIARGTSIASHRAMNKFIAITGAMALAALAASCSDQGRQQAKEIKDKAAQSVSTITEAAKEKLPTARPDKDQQAGQSGEQAPGSGTAPAPDVRAGQERLKQLGFYRGPIDGITGQMTQEALERFQTEKGIDRTGTFDATTRTHLMQSAGQSGQ